MEPMNEADPSQTGKQQDNYTVRLRVEITKHGSGGDQVICDQVTNWRNAPAVAVVALELEVIEMFRRLIGLGARVYAPKAENADHRKTLEALAAVLEDPAILAAIRRIEGQEEAEPS